MRLSTLLNEIYPVDHSFDYDIQGLAQNSHQIQPGYLFLASREGERYLDEAIASGAIAVLAEAAEGRSNLEWRKNTPVLRVTHLASYCFKIAAKFFNYPGKQLQMVGVTGTNGKTSCTHFIAQALNMLHLSCGVSGTLGSGSLGALKDTFMTTPDTITLHKIFSELIEQQVKYIAMEVSSHGLHQKRIGGLNFEAGIFTNLTQDHLDYHGDMHAYGEAKKRFFIEYPMRYAVINADDDFGKKLIALLPPEKVIAYSTTEASLSVEKSIYVKKVHFDLLGIRAYVFTPWGEGELYIPLIGQFNLSNSLAVLATLCVLNIPFASALACLARLQPIPGRMQLLGGGSKPWIVIDYAHTPDALEKALLALRKHCRGRLLCLFGCGGDRDKGKRSIMGAMAERHADFVMLTNDNPRHENPAFIIKEILGGFKKPQQVTVQSDRSKAIQDIIQYAEAGDYILIAGKGAEAYQQIGDENRPFSDVQIVLEMLR